MGMNWQAYDRSQDAPMQRRRDPAMAALEIELDKMFNPRPGQTAFRRRTRDIELDPMADGPGIEPLRPRRDLPAPLSNEPPLPQPRSMGVPGGGMPPEEDPEADMAVTGLRQAQGNLSPMLGRYALSGYGNVERGPGGTRATIHGDPVEAEASRMRQLRDQARQAGDLNRMLAQSRAQMIAGGNDYQRMDPNEAARYERQSVLAADEASPTVPDEAMPPRGVDSFAALRSILENARATSAAGRETAVGAARTFMDPTVTAARGVQRSEAGEVTDRDITGRVRAQLAGNPEAAADLAALRQLLGLGGNDDPAGDTGAGAQDVMTQDELSAFAEDSGMTPEMALAYVQRHGITVQ